MKCDFTIEDLKRIIYWVTCKFRSDKFHHQMSSVKRDFIGGFYDRWINRAEEFIIFRGLLKDKKYNASIDFFLYSNDTKKNAPDVLGLEDNYGKAIAKFAEYVDGSWVHQKGAPWIEVKNVRADQSLMGVRESQMADDHFYVVVESHYREDYLTAILEKSVFNEKILEQLKTDKGYIKSDVGQTISLPYKINDGGSLGYFRLIGIFTGKELKKYCKYCLGKKSDKKAESPRYISGCEKIDLNKYNERENLAEGIHRYSIGEDDCFLPFYVEFLDTNITAVIVKKLKGYFCVLVRGKIKINNFELSNGIYKVMFKRFDRSAGVNEYFGHKSILDGYAEDSTDLVIKKFDRLIK